MPLSSSGPAVQMAFDYVRGCLIKGEWREGKQLPSTRQLAKMAGVSLRTMIRAVARLKAEGLICTRERCRMRAGAGFIIDPAPTDESRPVWLLKRAALEKDMINGTYAVQGRLPSNKELRTKYGTCFSTMRKILRSMVADGALYLVRKAYHIRNEQHTQAGKRILLITTQITPASALNQGQYRVLDELERECVRRGLNLEIALIDFYDRAETARALAGKAVNMPALGVIVDLWWVASNNFRQSALDLLSQLSYTKNSVAILDEIGNFSLPLSLAANPLLQVFCIEDKKAGARVARMLLGMGHSSVVFISFAHNLPWSARRLIGIREEFTKAGNGSGVHTAVADTFEFPLELVLATSGWDDKVIRRILAAGHTQSQAKDTFAGYKRYKESNTVRTFDPGVTKLVRKSLEGIENLATSDANKSLLDAVIPPALSKAGAHLAEYTIRPLLEQALGFKDATAWICASDGMAFMALSFLKAHAISVPKELSVVGFDNTPGTTLQQRLSSFDFNASGFVHRMLDFIARPPKPRGHYRHTPIEVEGIIMQRDTVGPPRKALR
jgi:DNA-binding transcriptional regulator YhcF (GntR family)